MARAQGIEIEPSAEGFDRLNRVIRNRELFTAELEKLRFTWNHWLKTGSIAWSAWSIAQVDYNAEWPLREQALREAEAKGRLAIGQETQRRGTWVLSDPERAQRVARAKDEQSIAVRRADDWSHRAAELERQIKEAQSAARQAEGIGVTVGGQLPAPPDPFGPPSDRSGPPGASHDPDPQAAQAALAFVEERRHELELAHQHEADEREHARDAAAVVANPVVPAGPREKRALLSNAAKQIQSATGEIEKAQAEQKRIAARLGAERRAARAERRKSAAEADIDLIKSHLRDFNQAWGMTIEGQPGH